MKNSTLIALLALPLLPQPACAESLPSSFAYILQANCFAKTKPAAVARLAACGRDWIVLDTHFDTDAPWERAELAAIRGGQAGRKVIAYISIGEAEEYRPYWRKEWGARGKLTAAAPTWLGHENPQWRLNYPVKYWQTGWQKIILAAIDEAMAQGFDGVYLDIVDGFERFEKSMDDRINPETQQTYRHDMVAWVKIIAARARMKNPAALVIPQNGSQLLAHADYLDIISAIGIEDLFTNGNKLQAKADTNEVMDALKNMSSAKKPALLIEYPKSSDRQALSKKLAIQNGLVWLLTDRPLKTLGKSGR